MKGAPSILIIILNYNGKNYLSDCIESLKKLNYPSDKYKVLVVDNASMDGSDEFMKSLYPEIEFIQTGENLGYAGGNNYALWWGMERDYDYFWLLNNDTTVDPNALSELVKFMERDSNIGMASSKIYYFDRPNIVNYAGANIEWENGLEVYHLEAGQKDTPENCSSRQTDYACGCSLLVRRQLLDSIGYLDDNYFMYYEDIDWNVRAQRAGWKTYYVASSKIYHKENVFFTNPFTDYFIYYILRNRIYFAKKFQRKYRKRTLRRQLQQAKYFLTCRLYQKDHITVKGWAVDKIQNELADSVYLEIDGGIHQAYYGLPSRNIANKLGHVKFAYSGFTKAIPTSFIGDGAHSLSSKILSNDRQKLYSFGKKLEFIVGSKLPSPVKLHLIQESTNYCLDYINNKAVTQNAAVIDLQDDKDYLIVKGWAIDKKNNNLAGGVYININGKLFPAVYKIPRPDVAKSLNNPRYKLCGFERIIPLSSIGEGEYRISLKILTKDKKAYYLSDKPLKVKIHEVSALSLPEPHIVKNESSNFYEITSINNKSIDSYQKPIILKRVHLKSFIKALFITCVAFFDGLILKKFGKKRF